MEETPETKTGEGRAGVEGEEERAAWREAVAAGPDSNMNSGEGRSKCSRDGAVIRSSCDG